jgi:hypothetical protein
VGSSPSGPACTPGEPRSCGCVDGTSGVEVCSSDGSTYGPCACGDASVSADDGGGGLDTGLDTGTADAPSDAACSYAATIDSGQPGALLWADAFIGGPGSDVAGGPQPAKLAVDPVRGDLVVTGYLYSSADFGGGPIGGSDAGSSAPPQGFVAKLGAAGAYAWAITYGTSPPYFNPMYAGITPNGLAIDASGDILLGGSFSGTVDFGCGSLASSGEDVFVVELSSSGTCIWSKNFGSPGQFQGLSELRMDPAGNVLVSGTASGADFGGGALSGWYIAKFDGKGAPLWSKAFPINCNEGGPQFSVDRDGNSLLGGCYEGTTDVGCGTLTAPPTYAAFLAKFDAGGTCQWSKGYADSSVVEGVTVDTCGDIYVAGNYGSSIDFGAGPLTGGDLFVAKLDPSGASRWNVSFGNQSVNEATLFGIVVDASGQPTIEGGLYTGSISFGCSSLTGGGGGFASTFLAKLSSSGAACEWSYGAGTWSSQPVAVDPGGDTLVAGRFSGTLGLAGSTLGSEWDSSVPTDGFVAKLGP